MMRVVVTSRSFARHPILRQELLEAYPGAIFNDDGVSLSGEYLINFLSGAKKVITALEIIDSNTFEALPELKVLS